MFSQNEGLEEARARNIEDALREDLGRADATAMLVPDEPAQAVLIVREEAVLCGTSWFEGCLKRLDPAARIDWHFRDGDLMPAQSQVCEIHARARALLSAERPALNFLQTLSATASLTHEYAQAIAGASPNPRGCAVLDTRKTLPGLRQAQKYAVRVGGGQNQRMALWDGVLIKENHIAAAGGIAQALQAARELHPNLPIQVEVESLEELSQALSCGATNVLLDNFSLSQLEQAVRFAAGFAAQHQGVPACLEASGNVTLQTVAQVARTGVDRISIGALTKDLKAVDYSLRVS